MIISRSSDKNECEYVTPTGAVCLTSTPTAINRTGGISYQRKQGLTYMVDAYKNPIRNFGTVQLN